MVQDNSELSPEKQLLKLIEESGGGAAAPAQASGGAKPVSAKPAPAVAVEARPKGPAAPPVFSLGALQSRVLFAKEKNLTAFAKSLGGPLDLKKINALLLVLAVVVGGYFLTTSVMLATRVSVMPSFSFKVDASSKVGISKHISNLKAFAYYMEKVHARDIFKIGRMMMQSAAPIMDQAAIRAAQETVLNKFKLVGISWSDDPDAMVEETTSGTTHFMKRGQVLDGIKVQAIFKDKVVLNYNGVEVELR